MNSRLKSCVVEDTVVHVSTPLESHHEETTVVDILYSEQPHSVLGVDHRVARVDQ